MPSLGCGIAAAAVVMQKELHDIHIFIRIIGSAVLVNILYIMVTYILNIYIARCKQGDSQ